MDLSISKITAIVALLVCASATFNAYRLRGGKLAWSELLIAFGMLAFLVSLLLTIYLPEVFIFNASIPSLLFLAGFLMLLLASLKLRSSLR